MSMHDVKIKLDGARTTVTIDGAPIACTSVRVDASVDDVPTVTVAMYARIEVEGNAVVKHDDGGLPRPSTTTCSSCGKLDALTFVASGVAREHPGAVGRHFDDFGCYYCGVPLRMWS